MGRREGMTYFRLQRYKKNPIYANIYGKLCKNCCFLLQKRCLFQITTIDFVPVDDLPEGMEMGSTAVTIVDVIRVLPDIHRQEGFETLRNGVAGIGFLRDDEFAVFVCSQPHPT